LKNSTLTAQGIIPVAMALSPGQSWPSGLQNLLEIELRSLEQGQSTLGFLNGPTAMRVVGPEANVLGSHFQEGSLDFFVSQSNGDFPAYLKLLGWSDSGVLQLELRGEAGQYGIQYSTDLNDWNLLIETIKGNEPMVIQDEGAGTRPGAFYRVKTMTDSSNIQ